MVKTVEKTMLDPASDITIPDQSKIGEIEAEQIRDDAIFDENIEFGEKISDILTRGKISEESLSKKNKYCLELYREHRGIINVNNVVLKPWQKT